MQSPIYASDFRCVFPVRVLMKFTMINSRSCHRSKIKIKGLKTNLRGTMYLILLKDNVSRCILSLVNPGFKHGLHVL